MKKTVLCIGEILWDSLPEGLFPGGAPFNVAVHLRQLGIDSQLACRIGNDELGRQLLRRVSAWGLPVDYVQIDPQYPTGMVNIQLDDQGIPAYDIVQPAAWDFLETGKELQQAAAAADVLVFGSLAQREETSRQTIRDLLSRSGAVSVFDINLRPPFVNRQVVEQSLQVCDILKLNDQELLQLAEWFGFTGTMRDQVEKLCASFACSTICVTRGGDGAALWHQGGWHEHPGFRVEVGDTVGAGDAFLAGLIHALLQQQNGAAMLEFAGRLGAYVASRDGATPVLPPPDTLKTIIG